MPAHHRVTSIYYGGSIVDVHSGYIYVNVFEEVELSHIRPYANINTKKSREEALLLSAEKFGESLYKKAKQNRNVFSPNYPNLKREWQ